MRKLKYLHRLFGELPTAAERGFTLADVDFPLGCKLWRPKFNIANSPGWLPKIYARRCHPNHWRGCDLRGSCPYLVGLESGDEL